jgi:hypothetical protein
MPIPDHLKLSSLPVRVHAKTGPMVHCVKDLDHIVTQWPLPLMFGEEQYSFSLIDIDDSRYAEECAEMSRRLIKYLYDRQIISLEWRKTYQSLTDAEARKSSLPSSAPLKARDAMDKDVSNLRLRLLEIQDQRDGYDACIGKILDRCSQIKATIKKEADLEALRQELSERVKARFSTDDQFWATHFDPHSAKKHL